MRKAVGEEIQREIEAGLRKVGHNTRGPLGEGMVKRVGAGSTQFELGGCNKAGGSEIVIEPSGEM